MNNGVAVDRVIHHLETLIKNHREGEITIREMAFSRPTFRNGLNVTVRVGDKWGKLEKGAVVHAVHDDGSAIGDMTIVEVVNWSSFNNLAFNNLSGGMLYFEHDPACITPTGLLSVLRQVYPEFDVDKDPVSVVMFTIDYAGEDETDRRMPRCKGLTGREHPVQELEMYEGGYCYNCWSALTKEGRRGGV